MPDGAGAGNRHDVRMNGDRLSTARRVSALSWVLVVAQFLLIVLIISPLQPMILPIGPRRWLGLLCLIAAAVLALWALVSMRRRNFSVFPEPVRSGELVQRGPYRHLRHPMYSAVLLGCGGAVISHADWFRLVLLLALVAVLLVKIAREERLLMQQFPTYRDYHKHTCALFPRFARKPQ